MSDSGARALRHILVRWPFVHVDARNAFDNQRQCLRVLILRGRQSSDPGQALEALATRLIYPVSPMQNSLVFPIPIRHIHEQRIIDSSCSNRLSCSTIRSLSLSSSNFQPLLNSVRVASGYHSGAHFVNPRPPHSWGVESALSFLGL